MGRSCPQRRWVEALPPGAIFRSAEVPGQSRAAVNTFLSRESSKLAEGALCERLGADLYWAPVRDELGYPQSPPFNDIMQKVVGPGFGVAGHAAGCDTHWLTHETERRIPVAAVGTPPATRPLPYVTILRRSNQSRRVLNPLEIAYLEAIRTFDECAEIDWDEALRITARQVEHHRAIRTSLLLEVTERERCKGVARVRHRMAELCGVVAGTSAPPEPTTKLDVWNDRRLLKASHLPWLIETGSGHRKRTVPMSQFVKNWAHGDDDLRVAMCEDEPDGPNRLDLVRIGATVHALCDRDGIAIPSWVWRHRWHEDVRMVGRGPVRERDYTKGLPVCDYHRVWFGQDHIMDYRVHGFWRHVRIA